MHRAHLFSLRMGHALRESVLNRSYDFHSLYRDLLAGITVGLIAIPLAMALAIASGVAPQYGLYTAIIAGFVIPLLGGSRYSVSGPTAAFVVILYPISQTFGFSGLLMATVMAGVILIIMSLLRLGRLIEYIPEPVTLGFTAGIAVVIVILQFNDFTGLSLTQLPEHNLEKVGVMATHLDAIHWPACLVGLTTLLLLIIWPKLKLPIPAAIPAVVVASVLAWYLNEIGYNIHTIDSTFAYSTKDGVIARGIPPGLPEFMWPWAQPGVDGKSTAWNWQTIRALMPSAFAIAMLCAIESLLCAVVLDGMTGKRHSANSELMGQGIGNIIAPFFGGITATAAIARSVANLKAGACSPIAAMAHAVVVLLSVLMFTKLLGYLPMPAMAGLLFMVAWNMSEAPKAIHLLRKAPRADIVVFLTCFSLTVALDMVIAISVGIILASLLFMKEIAAMTKIVDMSEHRKGLPSNWGLYKINGPLFFAAADRIFAELALLCEGKDGIIIIMEGVTLLDAGGLSSMNKLIRHCRERRIHIFITDLQYQPLKTLAKAGVKPIEGEVAYYSSLQDALEVLVARS